MTKSEDNLGVSLSALRMLQEGGRRVFRSVELEPGDRQRLTEDGFLSEILDGWLLASNPATDAQDDTPWFASLWEFVARYAADCFGDNWCLSAEQSLLLHADCPVLPQRLVLCSPDASDSEIDLPFGTSLIEQNQEDIPSPEETVVRERLRLFAPSLALIRVPETFFVQYPVEAQLVLAGCEHTRDLISGLRSGKHWDRAGALAGAFRRLGRNDRADEILTACRESGHEVRAVDPFSPQQRFSDAVPSVPPIIRRLESYWRTMREIVGETLPDAPGPPENPDAYLRQVDRICHTDAYHSLSIEGYPVTEAMIERVHSQAREAPPREGDLKRTGRVVQGYLQAFACVRQSGRSAACS